MPTSDENGLCSVRRLRVTSGGGIGLVYREYRPSEISKPDIVFVHGLASSGVQFDGEARYFAQLGHRVLVPDLRGHGASGVPAGRIINEDFAIPVMARDVMDILDHAGASTVHWVGNSLGGILALSMLGTTDSNRLASLALFGTCFSMDLPPQVSRLLRLSFLPGAPVTAWLTARTTTGSAVGRVAIEEAIRQFNVAAGAAIAQNVRNYDFVDSPLAFRRPLLVLRGGRDYAVNLRLGRDIDKFAPVLNFKRVDLPQGGHCANFDMPMQFRQSLQEHWGRATLHRAASALMGENIS
ncbi:MAG TPA: alpha/beta fold hydrolase [Devosiaceae bacterium]|jgi:pimeloyl-ACP methyl ester carboxylesterase